MPYIIFLQFSPPALTRSLKAEKKERKKWVSWWLCGATKEPEPKSYCASRLFFRSGSKVSWFENVKACLSTESSIHLYIYTPQPARTRAEKVAVLPVNDEYHPKFFFCQTTLCFLKSITVMMPVFSTWLAWSDDLCTEENECRSGVFETE